MLIEDTLRNLGYINEVMGWDLEKDDVAWVNGEDDGTKAYMVRIWPGSGYYLPAFAAYSFNGEGEALEKVVAWLEQNGDDSYFCDEYVAEMKEELEAEGKDEEEIDNEIDYTFTYVDATEFGAEEPHYVFSENLQVYPYDEKRFRS